MLASKVSSKGQITIPKKVRQTLGAGPGDMVAYELQGQTVTLRKIEPLDLAFHDALSKTLDEWMTPEDDEAFRDL